SPYFFNAGSFHSAPLLSAIATAYAHTIVSFLADNPSVPKPDVIFGPAYKGIPLACATLLELHRLDPEEWKNVSYSFDRKEVKDHGEGGSIVGAPLKGKNVLVIDDVITAGTAMRDTLVKVAREGGTVVGFAVALDRQEKMPGPKEKEGIDDGEARGSAMGQIRGEFGVRTASIATLGDLIELLRGKGSQEDVKRMEEYRASSQVNIKCAFLALLCRYLILYTGSLSRSIRHNRFSSAPTFPVHSGAASLRKLVALSSDWSLGMPPRLIPSSSFQLNASTSASTRLASTA
ncbi:hypothetical protein O988_09058, partial [Pseudogymnoascus sp. VKM F-3808]